MVDPLPNDEILQSRSSLPLLPQGKANSFSKLLLRKHLLKVDCYLIDMNLLNICLGPKLRVFYS